MEAYWTSAAASARLLPFSRTMSRARASARSVKRSNARRKFSLRDLGADLGPGDLRLVCHLHGSHCFGHGAVGDLGDDLLGGRVYDRHPVSVERLTAYDWAPWGSA